MTAVRDMLDNSAFGMDRYHQESFVTASSEAGPDITDQQDGEILADHHPVRFNLSEVDGICAPDQTVLQAARAHGLRIPAACESGLCGTCKVLKTKGEVEMSHNGGILDDEVEEGYILACCSRPVTALEVEA